MGYCAHMDCDICGKPHVTHGLTFTDGPFKPLCENHYVEIIDYMASLTIKSATQSGTKRELWGL